MPTTSLRPFHLAFPVRDLEEARLFYGTVLGCPEGRSDEQWIDFDLFGHQIVAHYQAPKEEPLGDSSNVVDDHHVPIPHFGVVLTLEDWKALRDRLVEHEVEFVIEPYIRFEGQPGEQATLFILDPSGNALEFKAFKDLESLFAK